ncbi:response regulator [Reinekea sp. G2M2-21]|uniref:response regulator n=1 Tax=Reinekea sp. G2M2-21 TaxID=2788942 RepID=UPI0018AC7D38|nr:response regulator [Reinekea sp. G2M2-21]
MSKILIVEDSASMRQLASFTLKSAGHDVTEAKDGVEGLAMASATQFDAILTDKNMPNKNGLDMVKELRQKPNYRSTPIIMLTTESSDKEKQEGKAAGLTGWMVKPFQPDKLLTTFKRIL